MHYLLLDNKWLLQLWQILHYLLVAMMVLIIVLLLIIYPFVLMVVYF